MEQTRRRPRTVTTQQRHTIAAQIGRSNILLISGGIITATPQGIALPVSNGYAVHVDLGPDGSYTVRRVFRRAGQTYDHGTRRGVTCDQVSELVYRAAAFRRHEDNEW